MVAARMGGSRYAASAAVVVALCAGALFSSPIAFASLYGSGLYGTGAYGGTTTVPPQQALNPSPADGATAVSTSTSVSWTAGSGATAHAVYFGTDSTPDTSEYQGNQAGSSYNPGLLAASITYYWRIDEVNASGTTTGAVWSFTTADAGSQPAPTAASSPTPADLAASVSTSTSLSWTAGSGATTRGVYFGAGASLGAGEYKGNQPETTYDPGPLADNTTYWWRIDEANAQGTTTGLLWSFTTVAAPAPGSLPDPATSPAPTSGAAGVSTSQELSWTAGSGATAHAVYFGTDSTPDESEYQGNQAGTTYDPGSLSQSTTYYWRIDEVNGFGTTTGTVWSFTTSAPSSGGGGGGSSGKPARASSPTPADKAAGVSAVPTLSWKGGSTAALYGVFFGTDKSLRGRSTWRGARPTTSHAPGPLLPNTTYWWRIDSANVKGTTTGAVWSFTTGASSTSAGGAARADTTNWIHTVTPENPAAMTKSGGYRKPFFSYAGLYGMLMKVHEANGTVYLVAGSGSKLQQVYPEAKVLKNGAWQPVKLTGIWPVQPNGYYVGKGYYILRPGDPLYAHAGDFIAGMAMRVPGCTGDACVPEGWYYQGWRF